MTSLYFVTLLVAVVLLANLESISSFEPTSADYPTVIISSIANQYNDVAPKRLLRRYREDEEERTIAGGTVSGLATKLKDSASTLAKKMVGMNKYEVQVVSNLNLGRVADTLTDSGLTKLADDIKQLNSKHIIKKVSVIGILTAKYGDDGLSMALVTAQKKATDPSHALQIQALRTDQLTRWKKGGNSVDAVVKLLKINDDGYHMFVSKQLEVLDDYIKFVNPEKYDQTSLAKTLIKAFGTEDKVLMRLADGKYHGFRYDRLENSLMSKWAGESRSPANVFQWLQLNDNLDDAFSINNLIKITSYADDFNQKNPTTAKPTIELYTNHFQEADVVEELLSVMLNPVTKSVAEKLQSQQLQGWIVSGRSVDDVLTILKFARTDDAAIVSRKLDMLEEFVKLNGGDQNLIKILTKRLGGRTVALILEKASPTAEATTLQKRQFSVWVNGGVGPDNFMSYIWKTSASPTTKEEKSIAAKFKAMVPRTDTGLELKPLIVLNNLFRIILLPTIAYLWMILIRKKCIAALERDRLFEPLSPDDINLGEDDWLLGLASDTEGDEDNILYDMDNDEGMNDLSDEPRDGGDDIDHEDFPIPASTAPIRIQSRYQLCLDWEKNNWVTSNKRDGRPMMSIVLATCY
ncbi:Secreted RxLR effector peptide protein [Phytophthora palmivora]|uniref:Secreted RxLR effector peptide protein n=1 Tax=Phytophthora palmivora TaxID=4796 RepID=A0A2P4X426_9STRA|nr:Secreted RxLR effector peptide protein [Phytophthora palmivora]